MNLNEMIDAIHTHANVSTSLPPITKSDIRRVLDSQGAVATIVISKFGDDVPIPGLGKLKSDTRAARTGRNPATGEEIDIPAKRVAKFVPSKALKDAIA